MPNPETWTCEKVAEHFEEAITTLKCLPPVKVQGYSNRWPEVIHTPNERLFQEAFPKRLCAPPEALAKLEQTFDWMGWVEVKERKLIWKRAARMRWKMICWELGYDRSTAWRKWMKALTKIATRLNNQQY